MDYTKIHVTDNRAVIEIHHWQYLNSVLSINLNHPHNHCVLLLVPGQEPSLSYSATAGIGTIYDSCSLISLPVIYTAIQSSVAGTTFGAAGRLNFRKVLTLQRFFTNSFLVFMSLFGVIRRNTPGLSTIINVIT